MRRYLVAFAGSVRKNVIMNIPNFDPEIFKEITGIDTRKEFEKYYESKNHGSSDT